MTASPKIQLRPPPASGVVPWAPHDPAAAVPSVVDPKAAKKRNILLVSTLEGPSPALERFVTKRDNVRVVVPVVRQGIVDWIANDEHAFSEAEVVAAETAAALPAKTRSARAGEADVALAIRDALAQFPADEIVLAVQSGDTDLVESIGASTDAGFVGRNIGGVPLRVVAVDNDR